MGQRGQLILDFGLKPQKKGLQGTVDERRYNERGKRISGEKGKDSNFKQTNYRPRGVTGDKKR
jgi:hypothetical protein